MHSGRVQDGKQSGEGCLHANAGPVVAGVLVEPCPECQGPWLCGAVSVGQLMNTLSQFH